MDGAKLFGAPQECVLTAMALEGCDRIEGH